MGCDQLISRQVGEGPGGRLNNGPFNKPWVSLANGRWWLRHLRQQAGLSDGDWMAKANSRRFIGGRISKFVVGWEKGNIAELWCAPAWTAGACESFSHPGSSRRSNSQFLLPAQGLGL